MEIFKVGASVAANQISEWFQAAIDVNIPYRKYQVKPHHHHGFELLLLLPWLIEISSFVCTNRINLLNLK